MGLLSKSSSASDTSRVNREPTNTVNMPQVTELEKGAPIVHDGSDNTDSDSDDDVPELEETQKKHVQIGLETGCWSQPRYHPQVQEHPFRYQQTRRIQEPRFRYLHCIR